MRLPGWSFFIVGSAVALYAYYIKSSKLVLFIWIGLVLAIFGLIRMIMDFLTAQKQKKARAGAQQGTHSHGHPYHGAYGHPHAHVQQRAGTAQHPQYHQYAGQHSGNMQQGFPSEGSVAPTAEWVYASRSGSSGAPRSAAQGAHVEHQQPMLRQHSNMPHEHHAQLVRAMDQAPQLCVCGGAYLMPGAKFCTACGRRAA